MTGSTFGKVFKVSTWGESHGEALGCIIEGVPSKIKITEKFIQKFLERRKPCLLYTSPSPRDDELSRMPSSA